MAYCFQHCVCVIATEMLPLEADYPLAYALLCSHNINILHFYLCGEEIVQDSRAAR